MHRPSMDSGRGAKSLASNTNLARLCRSNDIAAIPTRTLISRDCRSWSSILGVAVRLLQVSSPISLAFFMRVRLVGDDAIDQNILQRAPFRTAFIRHALPEAQMG